MVISNDIRMFQRWFLIFFLSFASLAAADDLKQRQKQLDQLSSALKELQVKLQKQNRETSTNRKALQSIETEIGSTQKDIHFLQRRVVNKQNRLAELDVEKSDLSEKLDMKKDDIMVVLRLAYKQNNQPLIKLLLSNQRPEELSRHLYFFSVLTHNQQAQVEEWLLEKTELSQTIEEENRTLTSLANDKQELEKQMAALVGKKSKREQVLSQLSKAASNTETAIQDKKQEREKLASLIKQIEAELEKQSMEFPDSVAIGQLKGRLSWPVNGRLANSFGQRIRNSILRWEGWLIEANDGSSVKAVHGGRIVFADFFKTHGLLIIVDHGQGIWSLYGRNRALLREVGSWVEAGDVIAEVGRSGGYQESALYFEVRKNGKPQNPASWLKKR